jgi:hypothetical protein
MGRTHGIRRGTRDMFAVDYKKHGMAQQALQRYFVNYKVGDIVDIKVRRVGVFRGSPPRHTRPLAVVATRSAVPHYASTLRTPCLLPFHELLCSSMLLAERRHRADVPHAGLVLAVCD